MARIVRFEAMGTRSEPHRSGAPHPDAVAAARRTSGDRAASVASLLGEQAMGRGEAVISPISLVTV